VPHGGGGGGGEGGGGGGGGDDKPMGKTGKAVEVVKLVAKSGDFINAVRTGNTHDIVTTGTDFAGQTVQTLAKIQGNKGLGTAGEVISAGSDVMGGVYKLSRGDASGATDVGRGTEAVIKVGLDKAGPMGKVIEAGINVGEGAAKVLNKLAPDLHASENVGEVGGQAAYVVSKIGVKQFANELANQLANDQRVNSDNVITRTAGQLSQSMGRSMQAGIKTAEQVAAEAAKWKADLDMRTAQAKKDLERAIPCKTCWPWDDECRRTMFDCRK